MNCVRFFSLYLFPLTFAVSCEVQKPQVQKTHEEIRVSEFDLNPASLKPANHLVEGNIFFERQELMWSGQKNVYAQAAFFDPIGKNVLFEKQVPALFEKVIFNETAENQKDAGQGQQ